MKNIIVYIHPSKTFNGNEREARLQIDNSLELGWKREDILLLTNFPYEYRGVYSNNLGDDTFCEFSPTVSKINAVLKLNLQDDLYWLHDLDAFQVSPFTKEEVDLGKYDMGVCNYGRVPMWATGTIFFKKSGRDILLEMQRLSYERKETEQKSLRSLAGNSFGDDNGYPFPMKGRVKLMNISYNFNASNMRHNWDRAEKPLKVAHFHLKQENIDRFSPYLTERFKQLCKKA
jgi:hypothetical protein